MITKEDLLRALDWAWETSLAQGQDIRQIMRAEEDAVAQVHAAGSMQSVSTGQLAHTYAFGEGASTCTSVELQRAWRKLIDLYDDVVETRPELDEQQRVRMMRLLLRAGPAKERLINGRVFYIG